MKPATYAIFSALAVPALTISALGAALANTGCAAEEDTGMRAGAAYPEPIGYTPPPPSAPPSAGGQAIVAASVPAGPGNGQGPEVVVGDDDAPPPAATAVGAAVADEYADTDPSALTDFRSTLDPYGTWRDDPTYGTVWTPSPDVVGSDFTPYQTAGHWEYDDDYIWVSDYSWGWAPFHYGRWVYGPGLGWAWVPGRVYAGAWVSWRYGDEWGYVGWAPMPPLWCWHGGFAVGIGFVPYAPYGFVHRDYLFTRALGPRLVTGAAVGTIAAHTPAWSPSASGRIPAHPGVAGPTPQALHLPSNAVVRTNAADRNIAQARAFSRPSTAVALGAHGPQMTAANSAFAGQARSSTMAGARAPYSAYSAGQARAPAYANPNVSHFGGRLGGGFAGSAASAPPARSYSQPYYGSSHSYASSPSYSGSYSGVHPSAPSYHSYAAPSGASSFHGVAPSGGYHGSVSSGGFHGGGFSGGGGFHGGGGGHGGGHR
jgi:hypothetical protein